MTVCTAQTGAGAVAAILRYVRGMDAADMISVLAVLTVSLMWAAAELRARELRRRLDAARIERDRYRAWARSQDITRLPGWEHMAGVMSRWSDAVDDTGAGAPRS